MEDNVFNEWAAATLDGLINSTAKLPSRERLIYHSTNDDTFGLLTNRTIELSAFTARTFPHRVQFYPVLYPFGGLDLLNARAAFPHAPAYVIMSNLPLGSRACFASPNCAATARKSAVGFLRHAHEYGLAWTSTERMTQLFGMQAVGTTAPIGVLPSLLLCARLMGLRIRSVRSLKTSDGGEHLAFRQHAVYASNLTGVVVETNGPRLVYLSVTIKLDRDDILGWGWRPMPKIDAAATAVALADIEHAVRQVIGDVPPILMLKAAPHYINRDPIVAKWALRLAGATLHDETGLVPAHYNDSLLTGGVQWAVHGFGRFVDWTFRERFWYGREANTLKQLCKGPELPVRWGYAAGASPKRFVGNGVLIAGWRRSIL